MNEDEDLRVNLSRVISPLSDAFLLVGLAFFTGAYANPYRPGFWLPEVVHWRRNLGIVLVLASIPLWLTGALTS